MKLYVSVYPSRFGKIYTGYTKKGICTVSFRNKNFKNLVNFLAKRSNQGIEIFKKEHQELDFIFRKYFLGVPIAFDLKLDLSYLTKFQKRTLREVKKIPYGETISYKKLAQKLGSARGTRAVGQALKRNPMPIIIACHRVIGTSGDLVGFVWGKGLKYKLLRLEGVCLKR